MNKMNQTLHRELAELAIYCPPGDVPYETAFFHHGPEILCVAAPQARAEGVFQTVAAVTEQAFGFGVAANDVIHDVLGVTDEVVIWIEPFPDKRGVSLSYAELRQSQHFNTREKVWDAKDDAGNPEPPDLGETDLGEHGAAVPFPEFEPINPDLVYVIPDPTPTEQIDVSALELGPKKSKSKGNA
jgi:hypothetical protein